MLQLLVKKSLCDAAEKKKSKSHKFKVPIDINVVRSNHH